MNDFFLLCVCLLTFIEPNSPPPGELSPPKAFILVPGLKVAEKGGISMGGSTHPVQPHDHKVSWMCGQ